MFRHADVSVSIPPLQSVWIWPTRCSSVHDLVIHAWLSDRWSVVTSGHFSNDLHRPQWTALLDNCGDGIPSPELSIHTASGYGLGRPDGSSELPEAMSDICCVAANGSAAAVVSIRRQLSLHLCVLVRCMSVCMSVCLCVNLCVWACVCRGRRPVREQTQLATEPPQARENSAHLYLQTAVETEPTNSAMACSGAHTIQHNPAGVNFSGAHTSKRDQGCLRPIWGGCKMVYCRWIVCGRSRIGWPWQVWNGQQSLVHEKGHCPSRGGPQL